MSRAVHDMFASIAGRYDLANDVLSMGIHRLWRKRALKLAGVSAGQEILDICCGTGDLSYDAAKIVGPGGKVVGLDFAAPMLELAREKKKPLGAAEVTFIHGDAMSLPFPNENFDSVMVSFGIRNVDSPLQCLMEMERVLKPGGTALVLEFGQPTIPLFSSAYQAYSRWLMPEIGGILTGNKEAYEYLPRTAASFPCGQDFLSLMEASNMENCSSAPLLGKIAYIYTANKVSDLGTCHIQNVG